MGAFLMRKMKYILVYLWNINIYFDYLFFYFIVDKPIDKLVFIL